MEKEKLIDKGVVATAMLTNGLELIGKFFNISFEGDGWVTIDGQELVRIEKPLRVLTGIVLAPHGQGLAPHPVVNPAPVLALGQHLNEFSISATEIFIMTPANRDSEKMYLEITSGLELAKPDQVSSLIRA